MTETFHISPPEIMSSDANEPLLKLRKQIQSLKYAKQLHQQKSQQEICILIMPAQK